MKTLSTPIRVTSLVLTLAILTTSCASTTMIDSVPTGADLYLNGAYVGATPHSMTDTKVLGSCTDIRIEKDSYRTYYGSICRTEEVDFGAIIGGIFFFVPYFWAMKYKPTHYYKLQPKSDGEKTEVNKTSDDDSLDQLWKTEGEEKGQKMGVENAPIAPERDGIIHLDEGREISPEEFEKQKQSTPGNIH
ncbi:MAG: PEGA domain-containing protein [Bacteroidales bacterium]|nr:PEGA domain-containing protein [Bacteroidales bacterium]